MFTPRAAAGTSTSSPPTAASRSPPRSARGAVHARQSGSGGRDGFGHEGSRAGAGGGSTVRSLIDLGDPVPGRELGGEERHQQSGDRERGHLGARPRGQPRREPHAERKEHQQKAW